MPPQQLPPQQPVNQQIASQISALQNYYQQQNALQQPQPIVAGPGPGGAVGYAPLNTLDMKRGHGGGVVNSMGQAPATVPQFAPQPQYQPTPAQAALAHHYGAGPAGTSDMYTGNPMMRRFV